MKYFSINYWFKMWLLSVFIFEQQNKNSYGFPFSTKTLNNSLMLNLLTNEIILANPLLNEKQNDSLSVFLFNGSKKQIQPFIKEQGKKMLIEDLKNKLVPLPEPK